MYASATATAFSSVYIAITSNTNCGQAALTSCPLAARRIPLCSVWTCINYSSITNR